MKNKLIKIIGASFLLLIIFSFTIIVVKKMIPENKKIELIESWFSSPYEYMFSGGIHNNSGVLNFLMTNNSEFMAGTTGIMFYGGINSSISKVFDYEPVLYNYKAIEKLSGIKCFTKTIAEDGTKFNYLNPEIIDWGYEELLPKPKLKIQEYTCKEIYKTVFSRFFRMMTEAYIYGNKDNDIKELKEDYINTMYDNGYGGLDILEERHSGALQKYYVSRDGTIMTPAMAIGFWIRRDIDGSSDKLWKKLQKFMLLYDKKWFKTIKK